MILKSGGLTSVGALATCGFYGIPVIIETQRGSPVAVLKSLDDDSHVKTRIFLYETLKNSKGETVARTLLVAKAQGYDQLLKKHGLRPNQGRSKFYSRSRIAAKTKALVL